MNNFINIENKCRICLGVDAELDWNDYLQDGMTYKDCYYKYTQLDYFDGDNLYLSTTLCRNCSISLENINEFISKAIETHNLLQERLALKIEIKGENDNDEKIDFETILIPETDIKPDIQNIPIYGDNSKECLDIQNIAICEDNSKECLDIQNSPIYENNSKESVGIISEDTATSKKQSRIKRKRKLLARGNKKEDDAKSASNELQNKAIPEKKKHCSKRWEIPTCCSICSKVLTSKYKAVAHERTHLKNRERNETCAECGMKFFNKGCLNSHMRTHDQNREKDHKCEFCDKAFYHSGALNVHRRKHLGQMIPCSLCTKEYCRQVDLDKHMISHSATRIDGELKPKKKYFVCCEICGENIRSYQYKSHSAKHMKKPLAKCAICNKEFFSRDSCIKHLMKFHKKGKEERNDLIINYKTCRYSNLFLQQNIGKIFTKE